VKASVFIGTSLDGFIARADGALDFLPPGGGEPHGYDEFMASVDAMVIGRNTYEIGAGIPLFGVVPRDITLKHVGTRAYASGLVQSEYLVAG
jgi:dihydrofolate reductase